jgi:agmatinase
MKKDKSMSVLHCLDQMKFPNYFADAEASFQESDYIIFGVPYDKTSSFRPGASKAPMEIRQASWNQESYNIKTGIDLRDIKFHDYGDLEVINDKPELMVKKVHEFTSSLIRKNKFPIAIGGEHSITPGIIKAFPKEIGFLSLDAHIDFREEYENEKYNHACVNKRVSDIINLANIAVVGIRSAEKEEFEDAKDLGLFYADIFSIRNDGIEKTIQDLKNRFKGKKIYLSLDMDVLDPAYAPGVSTPEPFGLTPFDVINFIENFSSRLVGFDVVEVCPPYDNGETAILAARFIRNIIEQTSLKRGLA